MKNSNIKTLIKNNIIKTMKEENTFEIMSVDELPTKVRANIDGTEGPGAVRLGVGGLSPRGGAGQQRQQAQENRQHTFHSFSPRYSIYKTYYE